jgi:hypothetical protein
MLYVPETVWRIDVVDQCRVSICLGKIISGLQVIDLVLFLPTVK